MSIISAAADNFTEAGRKSVIEAAAAEGSRALSASSQSIRRQSLGSYSSRVSVEAAVDGLFSNSQDAQKQTALPHFLPVRSLKWPDPIVAMRNSAKCGVLSGLMPSISRAWAAADNRLMLWNYSSAAGGRDFSSYDDETEPIVAVSLIHPPGPFFGRLVRKLLVVCTQKSLTIVGLAFGGVEFASSTVRFIPLAGFSVQTPHAMLKVEQHSISGRVFAACSDGNLYECLFQSAETLLRGKLSLTRHGIFFGQTPILSSVGKLIAKAQSALFKRQEPLCDLVVDSHRNLIFTLDQAGTISMWEISAATVTTDGLPSAPVPAPASAPPVMLPGTVLVAPDPLTAVSVATTHVEAKAVSIHAVSRESSSSCVLVVVTRDGTRLRLLRPSNDWSGRAVLRVEEQIPLRCPAMPILADREVGDASWCRDDLFVCGYRSEAQGNEVLVLASAPVAAVHPHENADTVITTASPASPAARVEAIDFEASPHLSAARGEAAAINPAVATSESLQQLFCPPAKVIVLHSDGMIIYVKLRLLEVVHCILLGRSEIRGPLLKRIVSAVPRSELALILATIAAGAPSLSSLPGRDRSAVVFADSEPLALQEDDSPVSRRLSYSSPMRTTSAPPASEATLGRLICSSVSAEAAQAALDHLRAQFAMPELKEQLVSEGGVSADVTGLPTHIVSEVTMSPMAIALVQLLGRSCSHVLPHRCIGKGRVALKPRDVSSALDALQTCMKTLDLLRSDAWGDGATFYRPFQFEFRWEANKVILSLPTNPPGGAYNGGRVGVGLSNAEAALLQACRLRALHGVASVAGELLSFFELLKGVPPAAYDRVWKPAPSGSVASPVTPSTQRTAAAGASSPTTLELKTLADFLREPQLAADLVRGVVRAVVETERARSVPQWEQLNRFLEAVRTRCPDLISSTDAIEQQATMDLDRCARLASQLVPSSQRGGGLVPLGLGTSSATDHSAALSRIEAISGTLVNNAGALLQSGALPQLCAQLVSLGQYRQAIKLWLHAAYQQDQGAAANFTFECYAQQKQHAMLTPGQAPIQDSLAAAGVSGPMERGFIVPSQTQARALKALQEKRAIVQGHVCGILETVWTSDRRLFAQLLSPNRAQDDATAANDLTSIWQLQPQDRVAHCLLFDWLLLPRSDAAVARHLRQCFVGSNSPWLEGYLAQNATVLGLELPHFYWKRRHDPAQAIATYLSLAQSPLAGFDISSFNGDRLAFRLQCLGEALQCARENGADVSAIEPLMENLLIQRELSAIALRLLESQEACLSSEVPVASLRRVPTMARTSGQQTVTQRDVIQDHLRLLTDDVCSPEDMFDLAMLYRNVGGTEVQLRILRSNRVEDIQFYVPVIDATFQRPSLSRQDAGRAVLQHYGPVGFPLPYVLSYLEEEAFHADPRGSHATLELLASSTVPPDVWVDAFRGLCECIVDAWTRQSNFRVAQHQQLMQSKQPLPHVHINYLVNVSAVYALHSYLAALNWLVGQRVSSAAARSTSQLRGQYQQAKELFERVLPVTEVRLGLLNSDGTKPMSQPSTNQAAVQTATACFGKTKTLLDHMERLISSTGA